MNDDILKTFAAAVAGGLTSLSMLPMLFKGKLRFDREYLELRAYYDKRIADNTTAYEERIRVKNERHIEVTDLKNQEIRRLQDGFDDVQRELRDQHSINTELTKQVFSAITFLQSLAGLAQKDQRRGNRPHVPAD